MRSKKFEYYIFKNKKLTILMSTNNININGIYPINSPRNLKSLFPLDFISEENIKSWRKTTSDILSGNDNRIIVITGPCSIHDPKSAIEYAHFLVNMKQKFQDELFIIMRVYFEKPRTTVGWKGLINDPYMDESFNINDGLNISRKLLIDITKLGIPVSCEFLDVFTPQYYSDLVTWGAIGARTVESQLHRQLASGLSMPIGFKNGTGGSLDIAVEAVVSSNYPHVFLGVNDEGVASIVKTKGNPDSHIILRGGKNGTNYDHVSVMNLQKLMKGKVNKKVIVDCSHGNSGKIHQNQMLALDGVISQYNTGENIFGGVMIESHLKAGSQKLNDPKNLEYGKSITDSCVDINTTELMLRKLSKAWNTRFPTLGKKREIQQFDEAELGYII